MSNFVVDNVAQLIVLLDVGVELIVLNCCDPFCCCTLENAHSGCCTLLMPIPDVAPPAVEGTCCKMPMVQKNCLVEREVDVVDHCCQSVALISNKLLCKCRTMLCSKLVAN